MSLLFPVLEQGEAWSQYPEVIDLATGFYDSAISEPNEYVAPVDTHVLQTYPGLGLVVVRNLFTPQFVDELTAYAEERGFKDYIADDRQVVGFINSRGMPINVASMDFLSSINFNSNPRINTMNTYFNKYDVTPKFKGLGEPHLDDSSDGPVVLLANGPGYIEISPEVIADDSVFAVFGAFQRFDSDSGKGHNVKVTYSGGDTLFFDGRKRVHRGSADGDAIEPRISVVVFRSPKRRKQRLF